MFTTARLSRFVTVSGLAMMFGITACVPIEPETERLTTNPSELAAKGMVVADLFPGLTNLCDLDMRFQNVNLPRSERAEQGGAVEGQRRSGGRQRSGGGERAGLEAMQVFDDLYFLGNSGVAAWLVGTEEDGFVLFDSLTSNEVAEADIIGGMRELGLDPGKVKHFIVSHGHGDHYGGHRYISEKLGLPVSMSAPDWALARTLGEHPRFGPAPTEGATIDDGQVIRLGDTVINLYVTSAHTPGTISPIITVHDNGVPHHLVLWGGTGLNFGPDEQRLREYAASSERLRKLSLEQGVDIFLSNHPARDGSAEKMRALASRRAGEPHPFVMGADAVKVFDILQYCPLAQAERIAKGAYPAEISEN